MSRPMAHPVAVPRSPESHEEAIARWENEGGLAVQRIAGGRRELRHFGA
jgi:hypothetical protein